MAKWQMCRLNKEDVPEHVRHAIERMLRTERVVFRGTTRTGADVRVVRLQMPSLGIAWASGLFEKMADKSGEEILLALPWAESWHVIWRCEDGEAWPDDASDNVFSRAQQGPIRVQTWVFDQDVAAAVRLCESLWSLHVEIAKDQEAN